MKRLIVLLILGFAAWNGYRHFSAGGHADAPVASLTARAAAAPAAASPMARQPPAQTYSCDGRTHCSQMRSCDEAKYFIRHCPNTKMDGDGDGQPCERQWCS